ncbi:MAG: DUF4846 domain-containing protein [Leptospiraceae bacterium]|nr:DUF4846 domain-containing protein [Leptospiraceae bacterium]
MKGIFLFLILINQVFSKETIQSIKTPNGYSRIVAQKGSFGDYLRKIKIRPMGTNVYLYNGKLKPNQDLHEYVLDKEIAKKDLEQCADAVMRLRADYLWDTEQKDKIRFQLTSGGEAVFKDWAEGFRPVLKKNRFNWLKKSKEDFSYDNFHNYLEFVYTYANTSSLKKELLPIQDMNKIKIGDVFIQTRQPYGHAVIVIDTAINSKNEIIFLLAQSYMPAQDIHVLKNLGDSKISPWYRTTKEINTPEWDFSEKDLYRFQR